MKKFISYKQSLEILEKAHFRFNKKEKLFISDTLGRVLACDIITKSNSPEFETSAMDGYALKHTDIPKKKLKIVDKSPAGTVVETEVIEGTCIKTFTGSLMPKGSDTLIPIENVFVESETICIKEDVPQGFAVRAIAENYSKGEVLIEKGTVVDFSHIGIMASLNIIQVEVFQKPTIAIASTGSEILDVGEEQTNASQIRSSNHLTLEAIGKKYGANVLQMGIVEDNKNSIIELLQNSLESSDIVVTTGGVSVGDYDFVKDIIKEELGATLLFQGVHIKPGQHLLVAQKGNKFIIGLPGFAYSSTVSFLLYVLPLLFKMRNGNETLKIVDAIIDCNYPKKGDKTTFSACNIEFKNAQYHINFDGKKTGSSAILTNMLGDIALLVQDEKDTDLQKGDTVKVILL